jgi:hypothetical protein
MRNSKRNRLISLGAIALFLFSTGCSMCIDIKTHRRCRSRCEPSCPEPCEEYCPQPCEEACPPAYPEGDVPPPPPTQQPPPAPPAQPPRNG